MATKESYVFIGVLRFLVLIIQLVAEEEYTFV